MDAQPLKKAHRPRWPRRVAAGLLLLIVASTVFVVWGRTEQALVTVVQALERASGGRLEAHGVTGTLYGPIRVQRLVLRAAGSEVLIDALELEWSLPALLAATVAVDRLVAKSVRVRLGSGDGAAPAGPQGLRVPIRVTVEDLRVDDLIVDDGKAPLKFAPVVGAITLGFTRHTLTLHEIGTPWARVSGAVSLGALAPFPLEGRANVHALKALPLDSAEVTLSGRLARVTLRLVPKADWLGGDIAAVLAPFAAFPLRGLSVALTGVDLSGLDPALGSTRATVEARLTDAGGRLAGPLRIENTLAGQIDANRIPFSAASGTAYLEGTRLRLEDLKLALGEAGSATGWVEVDPQGYAAELATEGLRLDRLHSALGPLKPAGIVRIAHEANAERINAHLTEGDHVLELSARLRAARVEMDTAMLRMPGGKFIASGEIMLSGKRSFRLDAKLQDFDPGRLIHVPARLSGSVHASGVLRPDWHAQIAYRIAESRWADAPLSGEGRLSLTKRRIAVETLSVTLGANRLRAKGRIGTGGDRLNVDLDAQELGALGLGASGALRLSGWVGGSRTNPAFALEGEGRSLKYREIKATTLSLSAHALEGVQGQLSARLEARVLRVGGRSLARLNARLEGAREHHVLRATVDDPALAASARAQGGLVAGGGWDGRVEQLEADRPYHAQLVEPIVLRWRPGRLEAGAGRLRIAGGELRFEKVQLGDGTLETRGHIENISLDHLLGATGAARSIRTDLVVSGAWDIHAAESLTGSLQLVRERGDVILAGGKPLPLEIGELRLDAVARANAIEAKLRGRGDRLGTLSIDLRTTAERRADGWVIAPGAPLSLRSRFAVPSLVWLGPLLNSELHTGGSLSGRLDADGTLNAPHLQGELVGEKLRVRYGTAGVRLQDGSMRIELAQDKVVFQSISFRGDEGTLTASGEATLAGGKANLNLDFIANKLRAVQRDDRRLVMSGRGHVRSRDGMLALDGEFTADRGLIELRDEDTPRLSSDVVIVRDQPETGVAPTRLRVDVKLNLGDAFYVKGAGLDLRMAGGVRVTLGEGDTRPRAQGSVHVAEGHYRAYGQQLAIERGVLLFDGPLDNPKLDILAVRKSQPVVAGVAITGTALSPRTALYSDPPVPDAQKLQWLVFGVGPGAAGDADLGLASSSGQRPQDEVVGFGAQIASALHVSIGQSLRNFDSFVQATLDLTERIAVQGRTGAENAVMLVYTWAFD